jgi:hypothetical protein
MWSSGRAGAGPVEEQEHVQQRSRSWSIRGAGAGTVEEQELNLVQ